MAGTFEVNEAGQIHDFGNFSGHYGPYDIPGYKPMEDVARAAFAKHWTTSGSLPGLSCGEDRAVGLHPCSRVRIGATGIERR